MRMRGHRALLVAGCCLAGCCLVDTWPAAAGSPVTETFLANLVPNVDFLDRSSRFALTNAKSARLRDFAHSEAREQTLAANAIDEWRELNAQPAPGRTAPAAPAPALSAQSLDRTPTGSVEARPDPAQAALPTGTGQVADDRLPMGQEELDRLEGLEGAEFDTLYKDKQRDALRQVETDYRDYIRTGDVPALKSLATRELPKIERRLSHLGKL